MSTESTPPPTSTQPESTTSTDAAVQETVPSAEGELQGQPQVLLHGMPVSPGLAVGPAHIRHLELDQVSSRRVPLDEVEKELNRFHRGLKASREQLEQLKGRLDGHVPEEQVRILDTHLAYLKDSVFLSDVENLILGERMCLEGAIAKVILDFDRIFRLVENAMLRERAVDLRDVGIRVLRSIDEGPEVHYETPDEDYVLVTRELSIVDMFPAGGGEMRGILAESGSLTSHAAILARSLRIPTLTGVEGLLEEVKDGDFLIVDATEGVVRVRPDDLVREQFREASKDWKDPEGAEAVLPVRSKDGSPIDIRATCGNLPEVERAVELGATSIGLYRTELLYLVDREPPTFEALAAHYGAVLKQAHGEVTFRLLDVDSGLELGYLHSEAEPNPELGVHGVRLMLAREDVLRVQLSALLTATGPDRVLNLAIPKVVDQGELDHIRRILEEERIALGSGNDVRGVRLGVVIETPASLFAVRDLAELAEFFVVGLDSFQQYLLAADRENGELKGFFEHLHPAALRALHQLIQTCDELKRPVSAFGITAARPFNARLLLGIGLRNISLAPVAVGGFVQDLQGLDLADARRLADLALRSKSRAELAELAPN